MSKIDRVENRIRAIEQRIEKGPQIHSEAFNKLMAGQAESKRSFGSRDGAQNKLNHMASFNPGLPRANSYSSTGVDVTPLAQSNSVSCGQTSVAMALNSITGKHLTDMDIDHNYGFQLLDALKTESRPSGYDWNDAGNITADSWSMIDRKVNQEKLPVIVALNGPEFSPSGHGHIVTIIKTDADNVTYADPATGTIKTTPKSHMNNAPSHPDGNFLFVASKMAPDPVQMQPWAMNNLPTMGNEGTL